MSAMLPDSHRSPHEVYELAEERHRALLASITEGKGLPHFGEAVEKFLDALKRVASDISSDSQAASERFGHIAQLIKDTPLAERSMPEDIQAAVAEDLVPRMLSLATTIAVCRISRPVFNPSLLTGGVPLVQAIEEALISHHVQDHAPALYNEIGATLDIWSQASGIPITNPTGLWQVQMDALLRGWRRPRVGRPGWIASELPLVEDYAGAILTQVPDDEKVLCLTALVERGMNRELALEVASHLGRQYEDSLVQSLAGHVSRDPSAEYPPLVQQALSLSRSVMRLTQNLVTGEKIIISDEDRLKRLSVCSGCPAFVAGDGRCQECGCLLKPKLRLATEHCPLGNW